MSAMLRTRFLISMVDWHVMFNCSVVDTIITRQVFSSFHLTTVLRRLIVSTL